MSNLGFSGFNLAQFFMPFYHEKKKKNDSFSSFLTFYEVENLSFISFTELVKQ